MDYQPGDKVCLPNSSASNTVVGTDPRGHVMVHDHSTGQVRKVTKSSLGNRSAQKAANDAHANVVDPNTPTSAKDLDNLHKKAQAVRASRPTALPDGDGDEH